MRIKLIKSKQRDLPIISRIYIEEFSKPPYNEKWTKKKAINKVRFFNKFYDLYTIKEDNQIVGFICVNPKFMCPGEVAFMEEMAIKGDFQDKGIGGLVIKKIFKIYKKRRFKKVMGIAAKKGRAIKLYKRLGILPSKKDILIEKKL